jgi:hypothetical protein
MQNETKIEIIKCLSFSRLSKESFHAGCTNSTKLATNWLLIIDIRGFTAAAPGTNTIKINVVL